MMAPKIRQVFIFGTKLPFKEISVDGDWAMNMLAQGKMDMKVARMELIKTTKNLCRRILDLEIPAAEPSAAVAEPCAAGQE